MRRAWPKMHSADTHLKGKAQVDPSNDATPTRGPLWGFAARVLVVLLLVSLLALLWQVIHAVLLALLGMMVAVMLYNASERLHRWLRVPRTVGVVLTLVVGAAVFGGGVWLMGAQLAAQVDQVQASYEQGVERVKATAWGQKLVDQVPSPAGLLGGTGQVASRATGIASTTFNVLVEGLLIVFLGTYLALSPELYRRGVLKLTPPGYRDRVDGYLVDAAQTLWKWLLGRLLAMAAVGALASAALLA